MMGWWRNGSCMGQNKCGLRLAIGARRWLLSWANRLHGKGVLLKWGSPGSMGDDSDVGVYAGAAAWRWSGTCEAGLHGVLGGGHADLARRCGHARGKEDWPACKDARHGLLRWGVAGIVVTVCWETWSQGMASKKTCVSCAGQKKGKG